jgi:hypothetical protein
MSETLIEPALSEIARIAQGEHTYDALIVAAVKEARRQGYSWPQIGRALGVSHQAAMSRFKKHCDA